MRTVFRVATYFSPGQSNVPSYDVEFDLYSKAMDHYKTMKGLPAVARIVIEKAKVEDPELVLCWLPGDDITHGPAFHRVGAKGGPRKGPE